MSAKTYIVWRSTAWWLFGWLIFFAMPSGSVAKDLHDWIQDPLDARPPILTNGAVLPGDAAPVPCPAQIDLIEPLSLSKAVDLALCDNPQIKATWAAIKVQAGALGEARAAYLPTLSGTVSSLRTITRYPNFPSSNTAQSGRTASAAFSWRLFDFGGRAANRDSAEQLLVAAIDSHDATLQKTLGSVIDAYFDALTASAERESETQVVALAQKTLSAAYRRQDRGIANRNDTLQAATALAKAQLAESRAVGGESKTHAVLVYALGLPAGAQAVLPDSTQSPSPQALDDLSDWLKAAQRGHPAILAAQAQWKAAQSQVTSARSEGRPALDFGVNYYRNGYPDQGLQPTKSHTYSIGFTLTIPIFDGFARTYKIGEAQAQAEQRQAQMEDTEHQIISEVVKAHADAESALANLSFSESLLKSAEDAVTSSQSRYDKGVVDILELLTTQSTLAEARQQRIHCLAEWRAARLKLMANAGMLGLDMILGQEDGIIEPNMAHVSKIGVQPLQRKPTGR